MSSNVQTTLSHLDASTPSLEVADVLTREGAVIVDSVLDEATTQVLRDQVARRLEDVEISPKEQPDDYRYGEQGIYTSDTKRVGLVGEVREFWDLMQHPLVLGVCDEVLGPNCLNYRMTGGAASAVGPGANRQKLHRDEHGYEFYADPERPHLEVVTMWALSDFTADNGATWFVPGSQSWELDREPDVTDPVVQATMPAGSVAFWLGRTFHGAGANTTDSWRYGAIAGYTLGWLRSQQNLYVSVPRDVVAEMPDSLRKLIGYTSHGIIGLADYTIV